MRALLQKLAKPSKLHERGIMGMNQRNISYVGRYNDRRLYPNVDNKLLTKELALEEGLAVPELIGVVKYQHDVGTLEIVLPKSGGFCIKPVQGSGGKGILVVTGRENGQFIKASGSKISLDDVKRHVSNILAGLFSLGGDPDVAMIESLIEFDPMFDGYSHLGVPDIRLIVFKGYPVMGMLRLATAASDGKANLHQGAVGVGINIANGQAVSAVQFNQPIKNHPDTAKPLDKIRISNWQNLLELAARCYEVSELGYLGVDLVLDKAKGPLVLELNARPGLSIQIANQSGLLPRLSEIEGLRLRRPRSVEQRIKFSMENFSHSEIESDR